MGKSMDTTWKTTTLGEITKWSSGGTPPKSNPSCWSGSTPWISAKTMPDGWVDSSSVTISTEASKRYSQLAPVNSVLLLVRGSGLYNRRYISIVRHPVAFNQDIKCLEAKDGLLSAFLYYLLKAYDSKLLEMLETTGIGAGKFDTKRLQDMVVQIPPLPVQQHISSIFSSLDDKIELNQKVNHNLPLAA